MSHRQPGFDNQCVKERQKLQNINSATTHHLNICLKNSRAVKCIQTKGLIFPKEMKKYHPEHFMTHLGLK